MTKKVKFILIAFQKLEYFKQMYIKAIKWF